MNVPEENINSWTEETVSKLEEMAKLINKIGDLLSQI